MRVAILGMGPSADAYARHAAGAGSRHKVFDEVWTVNAFGSVFKVDRIFHMDDIRIQKIRADAGNQQIANLLEWLQRAEGPIYTSRPLPKEPNPLLEKVEERIARLSEQQSKTALDDHGYKELIHCKGLQRWLIAERSLQEMGGFDGLVEYPLVDVLNSVGHPAYFTNTVPYALAMAIHVGASVIAPFGVDYSYTNRNKAEVGRACCEFWLGVAMERGIGIHLPEQTWLLAANTKAKLYGYDTMSVSFAADPDGSNKRIAFTDKPCPTAEEIEAVYAH